MWTPKIRKLVLSLVSIVLSGAIYWSLYLSAQNQVKTTRVLVAKENILPYQTIENRVEWRNVVKSEIPSDACTDQKEIVGKYAGGLGFFKGMPIKKTAVITKKKPTAKRLFCLVISSCPEKIEAGKVFDLIVHVKQQGTHQIIGPEEDPDLSQIRVYRVEKEDPSFGTKVVCELGSEKVLKKMIRLQSDGVFYFV